MTNIPVYVLGEMLANGSNVDMTEEQKAYFRDYIEAASTDLANVADENFYDKGIASGLGAGGGAGLSPKSFGAFGDGSSHLITQQDIDDNPQWIGTYQVGDQWDYVGFQECFYAAFAGAASTPGNVVWNGSANQFSNQAVYAPSGDYQVNQGLLVVGYGVSITFEERLATRINYAGPGDASAILFDSVAYATITNLTVNAAVAMTAPVVDFDYTGAHSGLATQQNTLINPVVNGNYNASTLLSISKSGGTAQGDTFLIVNPFMSKSLDAGIRIGSETAQAQNALSIQVVNGNIQYCTTGIETNGGTVYIDGTSYQPGFNPENLNYSFAPVVTQITIGGADFKVTGGAGPDSVSSVRNVRSEGSILATGPGGGYYTIENAYAAGADVGAWSESFPFVLGMVVNGGGRQFMAVDDGGPGEWYTTDLDSTDTVIKHVGMGLTPGAWVGKRVLYRYSNGYTGRPSITANTASSVTVNEGVEANAYTLFRIVGATGAVAPDWASAASGKVVQPFALGQGFSGTVGTDVVTFGSYLESLAVGDYIVIPGIDGLKPAPSDARWFPAAFIAKIIAKPTSQSAQLNQTLPKTLVDAFGYSGTALTDGDYKWLDVRFNSLAGAGTVRDVLVAGGKYRDLGSTSNFAGGSPQGGSQIIPAPTADTINGSLAISEVLSLGAATSITPAGTQDLTTQLAEGSVVPLTVNASVTLTATGTLIEGAAYTLAITASGTTSRVITFGTGFASLATFSTGTVNGARYSLSFVVENAKLVECGRPPIRNERGTFTPVITATTTPPTGVTYATQFGRYTLTDNVVNFALRVELTSLGASGSGAVRIAGLPFPLSTLGPSPYIFPTYNTFVTYPAGTTMLNAGSGGGGSDLGLSGFGSGIAAATISYTGIAANTRLQVTGAYQTDS